MDHLPSVPVLADNSAPWSSQNLEAISVSVYDCKSKKESDRELNDHYLPLWSIRLCDAVQR